MIHTVGIVVVVLPVAVGIVVVLPVAVGIVVVVLHVAVGIVVVVLHVAVGIEVVDRFIWYISHQIIAMIQHHKYNFRQK